MAQPEWEYYYAPHAHDAGPPTVRPATGNDVPAADAPNSNDADPAPSIHSSAVLRRHTPDPGTVEEVRHATLLQGALINNGEMIAVKNVYEQTLDTHAPITAEYLDVVSKVYAELHTRKNRNQSGEEVEQSTFGDACSLLRPSGSILVLNRPPGTSRMITAHALLAHLLDAGVIKEAWPLSFGGSQYFPVKRLPRERQRGYVLELPPDEVGFAISETFGATLVSIQENLTQRDSRLVVITTPDQWRRIGRGAPNGVAPDLGEARPTDIAARWLKAEDPNFPVDEWLNLSKIEALLREQSPTEVLGIVELMREARRTAVRAIAEAASGLVELQRRGTEAEANTSVAVAEQADSVVAARSNWENELYEWHEEPGRTSFQRNFLVAASVLRGASVGHVYAKAADLSKQIEKDEVPVTGQQAPGVISMSRAIKAVRTSDGILTFTRPHWDDAALEYFWTDRPLARVPFLQWLAQAPLDEPKAALESVERQDRRALAERIGMFAVRWAVRQRRQEPLEEIVRAWHEQATKGLWPLAVDLVDSAAVHPASASYVQSMLLSWATRKEAALQLVVVLVCTGKFGRMHTGKALRRLRHAAQSDYPEVATALQGAVRTLWKDDSVREMLFSSIVEWCGAEKTRNTVGCRTFAALAATAWPESNDVPMILDRADANGDESFRPPEAGLVTCWRTLLAQGTGPTGSQETETAVFLWLDAALRRPRLMELVLTVLRKAVDVRGTAEGRALRETLRSYAHGWVHSTGRPLSADREALRRELGARLDEDLYAAVERREMSVKIDSNTEESGDA